jgi:hypothetical protein
VARKRSAVDPPVTDGRAPALGKKLIAVTTSVASKRAPKMVRPTIV